MGNLESVKKWTWDLFWSHPHFHRASDRQTMVFVEFVTDAFSIVFVKP